MHIFAFLRLLQAALCSGLFARVTDEKQLRFTVRNADAARALGLIAATPGDRYPEGNREKFSRTELQGIQFCPLTLVHAYLGRGWKSTGNYSTPGMALGLSADTYEGIVSAADIQPEQPCDCCPERNVYDHPNRTIRETMDAIADDCLSGPPHHHPAPTGVTLTRDD